MIEKAKVNIETIEQLACAHINSLENTFKFTEREKAIAKNMFIEGYIRALEIEVYCKKIYCTSAGFTTL